MMAKYIPVSPHEQEWHDAGGIYYIANKGNSPGPQSREALLAMGFSLNMVRTIRDLKHMRRLPDRFRFYVNPWLCRHFMDGKEQTSGFRKLFWMMKIARRKEAVLLNL